MNLNQRTQQISVGLVSVLVFCASSQGDDAKQAVEQIFGQELRQVRRTSDPRDDTALASNLLKAAGTSKETPGALAALCETAYTLGIKHTSGYETAVTAMQLLAEEVPTQSIACGDKVLEIRRKQYYAARGKARTQSGELLVHEAVELIDAKAAAKQYAGAAKTARLAVGVARTIRSPLLQEIQARSKHLTALERIEAQTKRLEVRLKAKPNDQAVRDRLVILNLVDLDRPDHAAKYLNSESDQVLQTYVPLVANSESEPPESTCLELGEWYRGLAGKALAHAKPGMLMRAKQYYGLFLTRHSTEDLLRTKATLALQKVEAELAKLQHVAPGAWKDLLRLVEVKKHASGGPWSRKAGKVGMTKMTLDLPLNFGTLMFPAIPKGGYELQVAFSRTQGSGPLGMYLPIGSTRITLGMSLQGGDTILLDKIAGESDGDNKILAESVKITNNRVIVVDITVLVNDKLKTCRIEIKVNGKNQLHWKGPLTSLSRGSNEPNIGDANALGMAALNSRFTVSRARIRMLTGRLERAKGVTSGPLTDPLKGMGDDRRRQWMRRLEEWRRRGTRR